MLHVSGRERKEGVDSLPGFHRGTNLNWVIESKTPLDTNIVEALGFPDDIYRQYTPCIG